MHRRLSDKRGPHRSGGALASSPGGVPCSQPRRPGVPFRAVIRDSGGHWWPLSHARGAHAGNAAEPGPRSRSVAPRRTTRYPRPRRRGSPPSATSRRPRAGPPASRSAGPVVQDGGPPRPARAGPWAACPLASGARPAANPPDTEQVPSTVPPRRSAPMASARTPPHPPGTSGGNVGTGTHHLIRGKGIDEAAHTYP